MILDDIAAWKKKELLRSKAECPGAELRARARQMETLRPFAIRGDEGIRIIAEIKRATPSKGDLAPNLDPAKLAAAYAEGGAAAISVVTDAHFFKGSVTDLAKAREAVDLPILRKEFIIDEYQLWETRCLPADAVLLIARLLDRNQLSEYVHIAGDLGLATLVEVHSEREIDLARGALDRAGTAGAAAAVGINNRDLDTFKVDLMTTVKLAPLIPNRTIVSESGVMKPEDLALVKAAGAHAALVGESLVKAGDPAKMLRELRGEKP